MAVGPKIGRFFLMLVITWAQFLTKIYLLSAFYFCWKTKTKTLLSRDSFVGGIWNERKNILTWWSKGCCICVKTPANERTLMPKHVSLHVSQFARTRNLCRQNTKKFLISFKTLCFCSFLFRRGLLQLGLDCTPRKKPWRLGRGKRKARGKRWREASAIFCAEAGQRLLLFPCFHVHPRSRFLCLLIYSGLCGGEGFYSKCFLVCSPRKQCRLHSCRFARATFPKLSTRKRFISVIVS